VSGERRSKAAGKYGRVLRFVAHYWKLSPALFGAVVVARILSTLIDVATPTAAGRLIDAVSSGTRSHPGPAFWALGALCGLVAAFQISRQVVTFLLNRMSARAIVAIGRDAFARVQRFSADWHANSFAGSTVRKITRGMMAFDTFTDTFAFGLLPALIAVVGVTAVFVFRWPLLGAAVGVIVVANIGSTVALTALWVRPANAAAREWDSRMSGMLADSVSGHLAVKTFAAEERENAMFRRVSDGWAWRAIRSWDRSAWSALVQSAFSILMQVVMLGAGLLLWSSGRASAGDVATLVATQTLIGGYLSNISQQVRSVQRTVNDMDDVLDFREMAPQIQDAQGAVPLQVTAGRIVFDDVTFSYEPGRRPVFSNLSIVIPAGQRVGLVGHSGAGKSTFVRLLQRLYEVNAGRILIDGVDIATVTQTSLRKAVGLVPQEPVLFHRSLAENIGYGRPDAASEEVEQAARLAHADRFIGVLPEGFRTLVGERGVKLSGGERQRVAIARAILAATPILILDEATSSLDSLSERYIQEAVERLSQGRTTLVIAHRLSTVRKLDRILVFDDGRIIEDGSHEELAARPDGFYRRLLATQSEGLLSEAAE
jgi:ATP-binding cassette subfamily B protein